MVEKWRSFDNEAKKPYFDAARASPPLKTVKVWNRRSYSENLWLVPSFSILCTFQSSNDTSSEIIPTKKWRPIVTYSQPVLSVPVRDQTVRFEQVPEQTPGRVIIVQGIRSSVLHFFYWFCELWVGWWAGNTEGLKSSMYIPVIPLLQDSLPHHSV